MPGECLSAQFTATLSSPHSFTRAELFAGALFLTGVWRSTLHHRQELNKARARCLVKGNGPNRSLEKEELREIGGFPSSLLSLAHTWLSRWHRSLTFSLACGHLDQMKYLLEAAASFHKISNADSLTLTLVFLSYVSSPLKQC